MKTSTGMTVSASLINGQYQKGVKVSQEEIAALNITKHPLQPKRNYTLHPHKCLTEIMMRTIIKEQILIL
jgi:hypothetical protein